jgi:hypothetical protein
LRPAHNLIWEEISGELIVFKTDEGKYYRLNHTGLLVWLGMVEKLSQIEIVKKITKQYRRNESEIEDDVKSFISDLKNEGLVLTDE